MSSPSPQLPLYDPIRWDFFEHAHEIYDQLRSQQPVHWVGELDQWVVTSYEGVRSTLRDNSFRPLDVPASFAAQAAQAGESFPTAVTLFEAVTFFDSSPGHLAARRYLNRALNDRPLSELAPLVQAITAEQAGHLRQAGGGDLMALFARPIPYRVMANLLGIPEADLPLVTDTLTGITPLFFHRTSRLEQFREANSLGTVCLDYMEELIRERQAKPRSDGISRMLADPPLREQDPRVVAARVMFLFLVGIETVAGLLGESMQLLITHPAQAELWRTGQASDETSLDELLRYISPVTVVRRQAAEDILFHGQQIRNGQNVTAILAAANRDPARFENPHRLDLRRNGPTNLAFGDGAHLCLGAALARLQGRLALPSFLNLPPMALSGNIMRTTLDFLTLVRAIPFELV